MTSDSDTLFLVKSVGKDYIDKGRRITPQLESFT